jgi:hypothetical protein
VRRQGQIINELETVQRKLEEIDRDRELLLREESELRSELEVLFKEQDRADLQSAQPEDSQWHILREAAWTYSMDHE